MAQWHSVLIWERFFALTAPILHPGVYICTNKLSGKPEKMPGQGVEVKRCRTSFPVWWLVLGSQVLQTCKKTGT